MPNSLVDHVTEQLLHEDKLLLEKTQFPILTVSASFRDVVEAQHHKADKLNHPDVTFSRAHYSMALAVGVTAWQKESPEPKKAWIVDPTNYVTNKDWRRVATSETLGRLLARHSVLGWVKKHLVDKYARQKFPLEGEILPPLMYLSESLQQPIISLHIVIGNLLAQSGKKIVQVVTDPHVRPDYIEHANLPNMTFCVFDEKTKYDFLALAADYGKKVDPDRVVVTGPPIDPRLFAMKDEKKTDSWRRRPTRILLTTGGLGTNKEELRIIVEKLLPLLRKQKSPIQLVYYAGTNQDHADMVRSMAKAARVSVGENSARRASLRILFADDIVDANNLLMMYGLPWADLVVTKPSGDMAYDAIAAGCALFFLQPWGEWEENIRAYFTQQNLARVITPEKIVEHIEESTNRAYEKPWLESALEKTRLMPPIFSRGTTNILQTARRQK